MWGNETRLQSCSNGVCARSRTERASLANGNRSRSRLSSEGLCSRRGAVVSKRRSRGVATLLLCTVLALTALVPTTVAAKDKDEAPRRDRVVHEGAEGVWFRLDVAREMLGDLHELELLRQRVKLLDQRLTLSDELVALETRRAELAVEQADTAEGALEESVRGRRRVEERLEHWSRQPWTWVAVSALVGALGVGFGVWVAGE